MGAVNDRAAGRDFLDRIDERNPPADEVIHDVLVMHDLVVDVDRGAVVLEHLVDALDGHVDAGTETAGVCEDDLHRMDVLDIVSGRNRSP